MPRSASLILTWSSTLGTYELCRPGDGHSWSVVETEWLVNLAESPSLAFRGQHGHLTLRKEGRQRGGEGYWYAYRSLGQKTRKKYAGRTSDLSLARLEEIATALGSMPDGQPLLAGQAEARSNHQASGSQGTRPVLPLLAPKLSLPRLPAGLVARQGLKDRLNASLQGKLTLLCAPAGYGKTTLAAQWLTDGEQNTTQRAVAWVALDNGDNDPVRFWRYMITACQGIYCRAGAVALGHLHMLEAGSFEPLSLEIPLTLLLNELSQSPGRGILVLEDYHAITEPSIHASLAFFLAHLPPTLHLVLISRTEPPLPLAPLRADGMLTHFTASDLRFSLAETSTLLAQHLVPVAGLAERVSTLVDGWVAGLRLFLHTLSGKTLEEHLATFSGAQHHLLDYFLAEVLATQSAEIQLFLLQTSVLHNLNAALCDALTGRQDSAQVLMKLEQANLFLAPLEGQENWYRYHQLFAEALRYEARRRLDEQARRICYERASFWYEQHAQVSEALEMALAARSFERAAMLLERITGPQRFHEMPEHLTLQRWLLALSEETLQRHPLLALTLAMVRLFASDCQQRLAPPALALAEQPLCLAEGTWQAAEDYEGLGEALALRVVIARLQGHFPHAVDLARQALAWLAEDALQWRATCLGTLGEEAWREGDLASARRIFLEAHRFFREVGNHYGQRVALLKLAEIATYQGRLREGAAVYREVLATAGEDLSDRGQALLGLAELAYERSDLDAAEALAGEVRQIGEQTADEMLKLQAALLLATILAARGQCEKVFQDLAGLLAQAQTQAAPLLYRQILAQETLLRARTGYLEPRWLAWQQDAVLALPAWQQEREKLLTARVLTGQGQHSAALELLESVRARARDQGRTRDELAALILMALLYTTTQNEAQTHAVLIEALRLACTEEYMRLFLDEGESVATLLRTLSATRVGDLPRAYMRKLSLAFAGTSAEASSFESVTLPQTIEPFSPQEQRVFRLLAAGCSNGEIARTLVVSPNTVKTQIQSIYRKLNVHSRGEVRQALRAQHLA